MSRFEVAAWAAFALTVSACGQQDTRGEVARPQAPGGQADQADAQARAWGSAPARPARAVRLAHLPGRLEVVSSERHEVGPPVGGELVRWLVRPGDRVEVGSPLAEIVDGELIGLRAELTSLRRLAASREEIAEQARARQASGVIGSAEVREAELELERARSGLEAARKRLAARSALGVGRRTGPGRREWTSAVAGVVTRTTCSAGQVLSAGDACVELVDATRPLLVVRVPERLAARLGALREARWLPTGAPAPIALERVRTAPTLDGADVALATYWSLGEGAEGLRPGASGRATLEVGPPPGALEVDRAAITQLDGRDHVFVDRGEGEPEPLAVEVLGERDALAIVRAPGLSEGDEVVVRGVFGVKSALLLAGGE
jgi:multidrug efflux pump subunit AcrA (membrane-fusion protein)